FNDTAYFAHKNYQPRKLLRSGDTDWALAACVFNDGPYMDKEDVATTLKPGATGAADVTNEISSDEVTGGYLELTLASAQAVDNYWITSTSPENVGDSPNGWTLSG